MDPPEEVNALELSSLLEETINDHDSSNNGRPPLHPSRQLKSPRYNNQQQTSVRKGNNYFNLPVAFPPIPSASTSATSSNNKFSFRQLVLIFNLVGIVIILVIISSKTEKVIESNVEGGTTYEVLHNHKVGDDDSSPHTVVTNKEGGMIGFHNPSLENTYGANHYYKPKGVGYSIRPQGGLHPIYMLDMTDDDKKQLEVNADYYEANNYELSPYSDKRLKLTDNERITENNEWKAKLQKIRDTYGYWNFVDDYSTKNNGKSRPTVNWSNYNVLLGEIDRSDFPKDSWQTDDVYITNFITEGKALIKRVIQSISDEYGWDTPESTGGIQLPDATSEEKKNIGGNFGIAWMYEKSFEALVKKLLNAMITNDHFFVTLGGHSAAAGHGNNFWQGYMMEFQHVMEPVFDRLGMVLVSANRAQGGMGTLQTAIAGSGIYGGDHDVILWDSSMTEKDGRAQDVFIRQALMAGERAPILLDLGGGKGAMDKLHNEVGAHVGGIHTTAILPKFNNITIDFGEKKYNAACWTERVDVKPDVQYDAFGGQASWHPGNWVHQSTARKISLLFLHALDEALSLWEKYANDDGGNPLDGKYWHLQKEEDTIRNAVKNANATATECGNIFNYIPRMCTIPMRGAAEWTPRNNPYHSSIRSLAKAAPTGYLPGIIDVEEQVYLGREPLIPSQRVPKGEVDVAMVARSLPPLDSSSTRRRRSLASSSKRRNLNETTKVISGDGWTSIGHPAGYCDGTSNALCYREKSSHCIMSGHNDGRGTMYGDGLSGWLVLELKDVSEGLFMARMESWHEYNSNKRTEGWEKVNNGREDLRRQQRRRRLKKPPPPLPDDFRFEVAINGDIVSSWNKTEYQAQCPYVSYNNNICLIWNDEERAKKKEKEDIEFAMRIDAPSSGRIAVLGMTHIYYA